jgi:uncharacterized membrane protein YcaP (DUF421 family)
MFIWLVKLTIISFVTQQIRILQTVEEDEALVLVVLEDLEELNLKKQHLKAKNLDLEDLNLKK